MSKTVAVVTMVRNEGEGWLPKVLPIWQQFSDQIIALDDNSTDNTAVVLTDHGATVLHSPYPDKAWGNEAYPRKYCFEQALHSSCDYLLWLDCDMVPANDPKDLIVPGMAKLSAPLYDLWSKDTYREDAYWCGHLTRRVWMIANPGPAFKPMWVDRGIHCGHIPLNLPAGRWVFAPQEYSLLHYGYVTPERRARKHADYMSLHEILEPQELAHAETIIDAQPRLRSLPFEPRWNVPYEP